MPKKRKGQREQASREQVRAEPTPLGRRYKVYFTIIAVFCVCLMALIWTAMDGGGVPTYKFSAMYGFLETYMDNWAVTHPHLVKWEVGEPIDDWSQPVNLVLYIDDEATPAEVAEWERFFLKWTACTIGQVREYSGYTTEVRRVNYVAGNLEEALR